MFSRFRLLTQRRLLPLLGGAALLAGYAVSAQAQPASAWPTASDTSSKLSSVAAGAEIPP